MRCPTKQRGRKEGWEWDPGEAQVKEEGIPRGESEVWEVKVKGRVLASRSLSTVRLRVSLKRGCIG